MDSQDDAANPRWVEAFSARARAYWTEERTAELAHGKRLLLPPAESAPLLRAIGLLHRDASMPPAQVRKYWQVCHMVAMLGPAVRELAGRDGVVRLLDAGCGNSYLGLALAWCARDDWGVRLELLGVDREAGLIGACARRAAVAGLGEVARFVAAPVGELDLAAAWTEAFGAPPERIHAVLGLHACDTATCDALALGVRLGVDLIAVAPCCQVELSRAWGALAEARAEGPLAPVWASPHLRRQTAAHVTDTLRTLLLRASGYDVAAMEFVPSEHTPKNTLIRARRGRAPDPGAWAEYEALVAATGGAGIALAERLRR